jgi:hypothetical protein
MHASRATPDIYLQLMSANSKIGHYWPLLLPNLNN